MRAYTLRTMVRFGMMTAVTAGATLATVNAQADVAGSSNRSTGTAELIYEHNKGLPTTIETGPKGITSPFVANINVGVKIDPVKNGGPLFIVDMSKGAIVEASWGNDKYIVLKGQTGAATDGIVKVRHTLTPSVDLLIKAFGLNTTFSYNANDLLAKIPGGRFNYDSKAEQPFAPWAFTPAETKLGSPSLDNATLFSLNLDILPATVSDNITGHFGVKAITKPTFAYKTTKVMFSGVDGAIASGSDELSLAAVDGDFMELMVAVEGEMNVTGTMDIWPFVHIDTIGNNINLDQDLGITAAKFNYTVPATKVNFQTALVHIPLPNVRVPKKGLDFGTVKVGGHASKAVLIENTGEMDATMSFASSDEQFQVTGGTVTVPSKSSYELIVKFSPDGANPALSEITVHSNDPDSPEQVFKVGANGADVGSADDDEDGGSGRLPAGDDEADASGCGCKAAGSSSVPGWAGLGLAGLGAAVLFRRRRKVA